MVNEVLRKLLCHNLLIREQETLGIVPVFWDDEETEDAGGPVILSLPQAQ